MRENDLNCRRMNCLRLIKIEVHYLNYRKMKLVNKIEQNDSTNEAMQNNFKHD